MDFTYFEKCLIFFKRPLMSSLNILCSDRHNFLKEVTQKKNRKEAHKKIFCGPSKLVKNILWPINICLKYFMAPAKTLQAPTSPLPCLLYTIYLMCSPLFKYRTSSNRISYLPTLPHSAGDYCILKFSPVHFRIVATSPYFSRILNLRHKK